MNKEEAEKIVAACSAYIGDGYQPGEVILDGNFTLEQLEAIIFLERLEASK